MVRISALLGLMFILAWAPLGAQAQATASISEQGIRVELTLDKTELVVGEPVNLIVKVVNDSSRSPVSNFSAKFFFTEANGVKVMVSPPGELPARYEGADQRIMYPSVEVNLQKGESWREIMPLIYDNRADNGYLFNKPGRYVVSAELTGSILREATPAVVSRPPTAVTVKSADDNSAAAFKFLANPDMAKSLQNGMAENEQVAKTARKVASDFPDTPYAPYALYLAATWNMRPQGPNYDQAASDFRAMVERYPSHVMVSPSVFNLVLCSMALKQEDVARDWFWYLRDADPAYALMRRENPTAAYFYFNHLEAAEGRRWWMVEKPWVSPQPEAEKAPKAQPVNPAMQ